MDRLIYTAMTGASHTLQQQAAVAQNLANVNTPGFRSTIDAFRSVPLVSRPRVMWSSQRLWPISWSVWVAFMISLLK